MRVAGVVNGDAARKAFVANRVGDFAMILAMSLIFWTFSTLEFEGVTASALQMFEGHAAVSFGMFEASFPAVLTAITVLLLIGATGKSGSDSIVYLVARRDGGPDTGFSLDPCGDDGDLWDLPDYT